MTVKPACPNRAQSSPEGDEGNIPTAAIQPIGLLVNELVTNAAKYGRGPILVQYEVRDPVHTLSVCDGGEGLPENFKLDESRASLGVRVVTALASQLNGDLSAAPRANVSGACFTLAFEPTGASTASASA